MKIEKEYAKENKNRKLKELETESKTIKRANMPQFKEKIKRIMNKENEKINLLTEHIKKMNEIIKNEYIPIPEYIIINEE